MVQLTKTSQPPPKPEQTRHSTTRRWWKLPLLLIFTLVFLSSGWFTYKVASATGKVFADNTTSGSPLLKGKKLKDDQFGRITILLIGIGGEGHDGPNLADTVQVASIDPKSKQVAMLSLPRDLYVSVPPSAQSDVQKVKLNEVHAIGEDTGNPGGGPALLKEKVSEVLGVPIQYFIRADFAGFTQVVDSVGGINVNVSERLYDPFYPKGRGYEVLDIKPGQQQMNGELALKYARSRETTSDFDRSRRQQETIVGVRDKALSLQYLSNPGKTSQLIEIVGDHIRTDLSLQESQRLGQIVKDIPSGAVQSRVLDNETTGLLTDSVGPGGAFILVPAAGPNDFSEIKSFATNYFNHTDSLVEQAGIDLQNASGREGSARQEFDALSALGYKMVGATNATATAPETVIYDFSNGSKPATVRFLEQRFKGAQVIRQSRDTPSVDVRVVLGSNYVPATEQSGGVNQ